MRTQNGFPRLEQLLLRGREQASLLDRASGVARSRFGRRVFVRGVVEISNFCRENCCYCGMRRENRSLARYRAIVEQVAEFLLHRRPSSITDINLQSGEDPVAVREIALPLIRILRRETSLGISVCSGTLADRDYVALRQAGATIYIMKFETADADAYRRLAAPGTLTERVAHIRRLAADGWFVSSGLIAGLPGVDGEATLASCRLARELPLRGCSVSPFVPGEATPLSGSPRGDIDLALNCMAVLRLLAPEWIIPAVSALNLCDPAQGYRRGLRAGANLVTVNLTPSEVRNDYLLYTRERFIMNEERVMAAIEAEGLEPSTTSLIEHLRGRAQDGLPLDPAGFPATVAAD